MSTKTLNAPWWADVQPNGAIVLHGKDGSVIACIGAEVVRRSDDRRDCNAMASLIKHAPDMVVALEEADSMLVSCDSWLCMCRDHFAESPAMESWAASCIERVSKIRKTLRPTIHGILVDAGIRAATAKATGAI